MVGLHRKYQRAEWVWTFSVTLVILSLAVEFADKDAIPLTGDLAIPWPTFMLVFSILFLTMCARLSVRAECPGIPRVALPVVYFWFASLLSLTALLQTSVDVGRAVQFAKTSLHLTIYMVFTVLLLIQVDFRRLERLVTAYYVFGLIAAAMGLLQYLIFELDWIEKFPGILLASRTSYLVGVDEDLGFRAASFFGEPSWAGRYYIHWLAIGLGLYGADGHVRHLLAVSLFVFALYTANSLLGYVIFAVFAVSVLVQKGMAGTGEAEGGGGGNPRRLVVMLLTLGGALIGSLVIFGDGADPLSKSVTRVVLIGEGGGAVGNRIDGLIAGLKVWWENPVFGVGLGNIQFEVERHYLDPAYVVRSRFGSESMYAQILAETGVFGFLGFLYLLASMLRWDPAMRRAGRGPERQDVRRICSVYGMLRADVVGQSVGMILYSDLLNPHLWVVIGIVLGLKVVIGRSRRRLGRGQAVGSEGRES